MIHWEVEFHSPRVTLSTSSQTYAAPLGLGCIWIVSTASLMKLFLLLLLHLLFKYYLNTNIFLNQDLLQ